MNKRKAIIAAMLLGMGTMLVPSMSIADAATAIAPNDANLQYFGRWDKRNAQEYQCAQGAVYIKANFTGTSIKVKMH